MRPPPILPEAEPSNPHLSWQDLAGLLTAVAAVPATALVLIFAAVTAYGPVYFTEHPVRIAVAPAEIETTGSTGWQLRDGFPD